jgi:dTDP-4-dehydrorhamnose reductase
VKVHITGYKGQLGMEMTSQLKNAGKGYELILTGIDELDITRIDSVVSYVNKTKPDIIINCAAYTAVDNCETNADTAYRINAIGPRNLAIAAAQIGARLVHISTDYVFNGEGIKTIDGSIRPYNEFDCPDPCTVYGKTKYEGELFVQRINPRSFVIRTAWLYGEGSNFVRTMLRLSRENETVRVVNDQFGSPTSTRELARLIMALMGTDNYGLFHGTCEGQCSWYEFTKEIFRLKGIETEIIPVTSEEFIRPAKRPGYSVLDNYMLRLTTEHRFNDWKDELKAYLLSKYNI